MKSPSAWIKRDFLNTLKRNSQLECVLLWGPRQVGKTSLLDALPLKSRAFMDDLSLRARAQRDPALFLEQLALPTLIDEAQYAPEIFSQIKFLIDQRRRKLRTQPKSRRTDYYLTGSSRTLLDTQVKESLAGRAHLYSLHGLSVKEIIAHRTETALPILLLRGGLPALWADEDLDVRHYLNDYVTSFVEKDIARSSGITKIPEFLTVLRLLAARTGQLMNRDTFASDAGVDQKTILNWAALLAHNGIIELLPTYSTNLTKRLVKMQKVHFLDSGLCARLMGFQDSASLWNSPQVGALFETLVYGELVKTRDNFLREWTFSTWRTKDQAEMDFVLQAPAKTLLIEAKLAIHGAAPLTLDREAKKVFGDAVPRVVVTGGGSIVRLDEHTHQIPIQNLGTWLLKNF